MKLMCSGCKEDTEHKWIKNFVVGGTYYDEKWGQYECSKCGTRRMGLAKEAK